ncbi:MAG: sigma 54-interacting transcriptional regulator, partial [Moorella sp. (in: Bacteria)]|nr:sigma 54-interacting transcriptional regulator [Moorella sp. (in: firmicutes)]
MLRQVPEERPADAPLLGELALAVLETLPDPCLVADRAGNIIYANPACACLRHRTPKELVGTNVFGYVPTQSLAQALKTGAPVQGKRQKLYGGPREVLVDAYPLFCEGEVKGAVSFLREVGRAPDSAGGRETMEKDVACLEARLAFLEKSTPAPVFFVGQNQAMREAVAAARRAAAGGRPLLLKGEAGSGKTLLAQSLHELSRRTKGPLVTLTCANLLPETAEAELLHTFSLASEGTVVLEEVGRLGPILQSRL